MTEQEYRERFESFVRNGISAFYDGIAPFYIERGGSPDSLSYFRNHFARFWAMIRMIEDAGAGGGRKCEIGSFYPYTTFYFGMPIDLYDIMPRLCPTARPYNVGGVRLYEKNICTEDFDGGEYDLIILSEVMEHLPVNLFAFERKVQSLLAPGGHILVTYPMHGHNAKDYELEIGDPTVLQHDHLREFTDDTVGLFFRDLRLVSSGDVHYPAYGRIAMRLYQKQGA